MRYSAGMIWSVSILSRTTKTLPRISLPVRLGPERIDMCCTRRFWHVCRGVCVWEGLDAELIARRWVRGIGVMKAMLLVRSMDGKG